jgi:hypothetical protein
LQLFLPSHRPFGELSTPPFGVSSHTSSCLPSSHPPRRSPDCIPPYAVELIDGVADVFVWAPLTFTLDVAQAPTLPFLREPRP